MTVPGYTFPAMSHCHYWIELTLYFAAGQQSGPRLHFPTGIS